MDIYCKPRGPVIVDSLTKIGNQAYIGCYILDKNNPLFSSKNNAIYVKPSFFTNTQDKNNLNIDEYPPFMFSELKKHDIGQVFLNNIKNILGHKEIIKKTHFFNISVINIIDFKFSQHGEYYVINSLAHPQYLDNIDFSEDFLYKIGYSYEEVGDILELRELLNMPFVRRFDMISSDKEKDIIRKIITNTYTYKTTSKEDNKIAWIEKGNLEIIRPYEEAYLTIKNKSFSKNDFLCRVIDPNIINNYLLVTPLHTLSGIRTDPICMPRHAVELLGKLPF